MYDPVLICNMTDYFEFQENGYEKSREVFARFLPAYLKYSELKARADGGRNVGRPGVQRG